VKDHPRSAFGASPSRGRTQRPGKAGSAGAPEWDRRRFLQLAASAAAAGSAPRWVAAQPRIAANPFTLGVASGSPEPDSVVLWTRLVHGDLAPRPIPVRWEIADDDAFRRIVASGEAQALPELAHSVHVEPRGLAPDRTYFYRFMQDGWTSTVGRTRTLPAPEAQVARLRIAYASCQRWEHGWFSAWRHARADDPDYVLFLGDYIYEYPSVGNVVRFSSAEWVTTLADYRARYALYKSDRELQAMHAACPWLVTWDDHEVQNDYAGLQASETGPEVPDFRARREGAYQAFYEHMPVRLRGRVYGSQRIGRLAQLNLLDCRQFRDPQACTRGGRRGGSAVDPRDCGIWNDPRRSFLGAAQERWLHERLGEGGATWNVIGQTTLFGARNFQPAPGELRSNDSWDGYPAARQRVVASLQQQRTANPVFFGGDIHQNWVGHVKSDYARPESTSVGVEFTGTSITSQAGSADRVAQVLANNPHFVFADAYMRGYGLAEFTRDRLEVSLRVVDDVKRADAGIATLAKFAVQADRPVVERA
jgi:alkaline phosphatase D